MGKCIRVRSLSKPFTGSYPSKRGHEMFRLLRAFHQHMFYVPSTYVLRPINICSTSHQHMFYVPSTYVLLSSTYLLRFIYVSSTRDRRYIYEGSTLHLRGIYVSSTKDRRYIYVSSTRDRRLIDEGSTSHRRGTLKRNESVFRLSPNQVVLAAFSCTKQVYGKPE